MTQSPTSWGVVLLLATALAGCDLVSGLSNFEAVEGSAGGGAPSCEPDSFAPGCPGSVRWAVQATSVENVRATAAISDDAGNVYVALRYQGDLQIGPRGVVHVDGDGWDAAVVQIDPTGKVGWIVGAFGPGDDLIKDLAFDLSGDVLVGGFFTQELTIGDEHWSTPDPVTFPDDRDGFMVQLAPNNGALRWSVHYGGSDTQVVHAVAADDLGHAYAVGEFRGQIVLGEGGEQELSAGGADMFVDKRLPGGEADWHLVYGDDANQSARSVTVNSQGDPLVGGDFSGSMDLNTGLLSAELGGRDLFVMKLRSGGTGARWARAYPAPGDEILYAVALDGEGRITLAGTFNAELSLDKPLATNEEVLFAAGLDDGGEPRWSADFQGTRPAPFTQRTVSVDLYGNPIIGGTFSGDAYVGEILRSVPDAADQATNDAFAASFDADGNHRWTNTWGSDDGDRGSAVSADADGTTLVGSFRSTLDVGLEAPFASGGGLDGFVLRLEP